MANEGLSSSEPIPPADPISASITTITNDVVKKPIQQRTNVLFRQRYSSNDRTRRPR
jgi:hypothetical protein